MSIRYTRIWRNKFLTLDATSIDQMVATLRGAADELEEMKQAGVVLEDTAGMQDDYATLVTEDPAVAEKFGFETVDFDEDVER